MTAIEFENVGKQYRLGLVSTQTLSHDLNRWWTVNVRHKEDPYLKIGEVNDRSVKGSSDYVWALRDINFKVEQGDVVGIIGRNGAGKSTLLKLLSRVTAPTTGHIRGKGRIGSLLEVGTGFHPEMTGRENIYMNGAILGMTKPEITRKLDEIVDFSGCERYLDTPVKRYSSGMMVRLGFAVAAHLDPEILVVDEVLAVGDAEFQKKAIGKMKDVSQGEGRTVLFVSHNMDSILNLCHNGILLNKGCIEHSGDIRSTVSTYLLGGKTNTHYKIESKNSYVFTSEVAFVGNDYNVNGLFSLNESVELQLVIHRNNENIRTIFNLKHLVATVYVKNEKQIIICSTELDLGAIENCNEMSFTIKYPSNLFMPGSYYVTIDIHIPNVSFLDNLDSAVNFTVQDNGTEFLKYPNVDLGLVRVLPEISVHCQ